VAIHVSIPLGPGSLVQSGAATDQAEGPSVAKYLIADDGHLHILLAGSDVPDCTCKASVSGNRLTASDFETEHHFYALQNGQVNYTFPPGKERTSIGGDYEMAHPNFEKERRRIVFTRVQQP